MSEKSALSCRSSAKDHLEGAKGLPPSTASRSRSLKDAMPVPARLSWLALRPRWFPVTCASGFEFQNLGPFGELRKQ